MTGMAPQRLCRSRPGDAVEIAARRADSMPFEQRFSDANLPAAQFGPDQPRHDQITPMLAGVEWQSMPALRTRQILGMDQGHLATIGQPPKPMARGIAILSEPGVNDRQDLIAGTHWCARAIRDENRGEPTDARALTPNTEVLIE